MKYCISVILLSCLLSISYAKVSQDKKLKIFDQPSVKGKVVNQVIPGRRLIPFYRKNGWLKVGDPATGKVGWINVKQYYNTIFNVPQRSTLQSVSVTINEKPDKDGKYEIVVYKNGKKIDKKEVAKVIKKINAQQQFMRKRFQMMQQQINQLFKQSIGDFNNFDDLTPWSPVIIFMRPKDK
ncbi:MAG: hypothetical protein PVI75_05365 [Gammaproteobacteria bacterium]|jgi:hypothetical protein